MSAEPTADQVRAAAILVHRLPDHTPVPVARELAVAVAAEFAVARLEERRAIVAWLRAQSSELPIPGRAALLWQAISIERGEHEAGR